MGMLERSETQAAVFDTIESSAAQDQPRKLAGASLEDLCTYQDLWTWFAGDRRQMDAQNCRTNDSDHRILSDAGDDLFPFPALKLNNRKQGVRSFEALLFGQVQSANHRFFWNAVDTGTTVKQGTYRHTHDHDFGLVLITASVGL
jgi:hypothetical protein